VTENARSLLIGNALCEGRMFERHEDANVPVDGLIVPTKATKAIKAISWKLGNANPVSGMSNAPISIKMRTS